MKVIVVGAWLLGSWIQNAIGSAGVASDAALSLEMFGVAALIACALFGYAAWRWEAERAWRRSVR